MKVSILALALGWLGLAAGCAGGRESALREALPTALPGQAASSARGEPGVASRAGGDTHREDAADLPGYVRLALAESPQVRASYERFRASVHRVSRERRLPEPTLGLGYFVLPVETRVGPQRARISLQQTFPWPTALSAGADAASASAQATRQRLQADALRVTEQVATAYWDLWQVRTTRAIHREHLAVIRGLSESVRARLATGAAMLADLQQIDLTAARIEDIIRGMDEAERGAAARLRAAIGVASDFPVPTPRAPHGTALPAASTAELTAALRAHPAIERFRHLAEASDNAARAEAAARLPSFSVGADWIITGEASAPNVRDSGQDAVIVGAGIRLPLWQGGYDEDVAAAEAEARAQRAEQRAALDQAQAQLTTTLSDLRDAARRVAIHRDTLVPQAESAYESVLGAYTVGRGTVAQALLSQRDLLELRIELERARADHARVWAELEALVGRELASTQPEPLPAPHEADTATPPPAAAGSQDTAAAADSQDTAAPTGPGGEHD